MISTLFLHFYTFHRSRYIDDGMYRSGGFTMRKKCNRSCGIGGQAVLEGVMMKNKDAYAVAVRKPDGEIVVETEEFHGVLHGSVLKKIPFVRGIFQFLDSMILGMRTLTFSASFYEDGEEKQKGNKPSLFEKIFGDKAEDIAMGLTMAVSLVLAVAVFMILPFFLSSLMGSYVRNASLLAILEGVIRIVIFVLYVVGISAMKDIHRLYQYHGAEHKCINCIEKGRPLTVHNVMRSSRQHKRCGTSFLLFVMFVSVVLFFFIRVEHPVYRVAVRIALVPVIAGISYEIIRLAGNSNNIFVRMLSAPGMWLQKLTTKEPDEAMVAVAIASVEAVFDWKAYLKETFGYDVDDSWLTDGAGDDEEEDEMDSSAVGKEMAASDSDEEMADAGGQRTESNVEESR